MRDGQSDGIVLRTARHLGYDVVVAANIENSEFSGNAGSGLVVRDTLTSVVPFEIENCRFARNGSNGIDGFGGGFEIRRSLFDSNGAAGCAVVSTSASQYLPDSIALNTSVLNGGNGITYTRASGPSTSALINNLVAGNRGIGLQINGAPAGTIEHNDAWMNIGGNYAGVPAGPQNPELDPGFCDALGGDFHVQSASPCAPSGPFGQIGAFGVGCEASLVRIDVEPGARHEPAINLRSREKVTFAILSHPLFDPASIDPSTVTLSGAHPNSGKRGPRIWRDVNGDGVRDLLLTVQARDLDLKPGEHSVEMEATLRSGLAIHGSDEVRVHGKHNRVDHDGYDAEIDESPELESSSAPIAFAIERVWPNPARLDARLAFSLPTAGAVQAELIDITGRRVWTRDLGVLEAGSHAIELAGRERIAAGVYFVRIGFGRETRTTRFAIVD